MQDASDCLACKLVVKIIRHKLSDPKVQVKWQTSLTFSLPHSLIYHGTPSHCTSVYLLNLRGSVHLFPSLPLTLS